MVFSQITLPHEQPITLLETITLLEDIQSYPPPLNQSWLLLDTSKFEFPVGDL